MINDLDHYEAYYSDKLWSLLPAVYRAQDTDQFASKGPLREMVERIGAQAAILRRSIDRVWEDQSIETCDDWIIPYVGDLLATNLVSNLDARGQRLDVANTIKYRRRKGTLGILEEIAADITGWDAKVVEFFRRLGRTRHGLDPAIGQPAAPGDDVGTLQRAEGLIGPLTRTGIGGFADLRNAYGASKTGSAFDEFFHSADFRRGRGRVGWYDIPRLGVFLWRLRSYSLGPTTPVAGADGWLTFDPTGRCIPLFARASRTENEYENNWISPVEAQLPTPIEQGLFDENTGLPASDPTVRLYPGSLSLLGDPAPSDDADVLADGDFIIQPARGRFKRRPTAPPTAGIWVKYHYGFSSEIGAGPYDRRLGGANALDSDPGDTVTGGGDLTGARAVPPTGALTLGDSLTYTAVDDVAVTGRLAVHAGKLERPLLRLPSSNGAPAGWILTGSPGSSLVFDGIFLSGGDLVLRGSFESVTLTCCTLDPGSAAAKDSSPPTPYARAIDGRPLEPTRIWIEGTVESLTIARSIVGPIASRAGGKAVSLTITDSIIQAVADDPTDLPSPPDSPPQPLPATTALAVEDAAIHLSRCTVLGGIRAQRLEASECILQDLVNVDNQQNGCVRFSAWADGSRIPRQYESVRIAARSALFGSTVFGQPAYGQLLASVDAAILPASDPATIQNTISAGAADGSEMGAFAREKNPLKERGLLIKLQEYMPAGLIPIPIYVT